MKAKHHAALEIAHKIENISYAHPVLIPAGCAGHAVSLCVEKTSEDTGRLIIYNTGMGVSQYHAHWKDTNRYQTHFVIEDIPLKDLQNWQNWLTVFKLKSCKEIKPLYEHLLEVGQKGCIVFPSGNIEDYEAKQMSGTCSAQNLMACVRHQIMSQVEGTLQEKLGAYRLLKAYLMQQIGDSLLSQVDPIIRDPVQEKLVKQNALLKLAKIAEDESSYRSHLSELTHALCELGAQSFVQKMPNAMNSSFLARFATLEKCSKKLASLWGKQQLEPIAGPSFEFASSVYFNRETLLENIKYFLGSCYQKRAFKSLGENLASFYLSSRFQKETQQIFIEYLCPATFDLQDNHQRKGLDAFISGLKKSKESAAYLKNFASLLSIDQSNVAQYIMHT